MQKSTGSGLRAMHAIPRSTWGIVGASSFPVRLRPGSSSSGRQEISPGPACGPSGPPCGPSGTAPRPPPRFPPLPRPGSHRSSRPASLPGPIRPARPPSRPVPSVRPTRPPDPPRRATQSAFIRAAESNAHNPFLGSSASMYSSHGVPPADVPRSSVGSCTTAFVQTSSASSSHATHTGAAVSLPGPGPRRALTSTFVRASHANAHNPFLGAAIIHRDREADVFAAGPGTDDRAGQHFSIPSPPGQSWGHIN